MRCQECGRRLISLSQPAVAATAAAAAAAAVGLSREESTLSLS